MEGKLIKVVVGEKVINDFEDSLHVFSPINNQIVASIPKVSNEVQVKNIYKNAKLAFQKYKKTSFEERRQRLLKFCDLLKENWDEISNLMVWEIAKPKHLAIEEIDRSIDYVKQTIVEYEKLMKNPLVYDENDHNIAGKKGTFIYEPVGVVLAISPFNYPVNLLVSKIAPALISGNVVVYKPATQGSCVGAYISNLLYEAGFDNGEISCIVGKGSEIGDFIIDNPNIDMISFTGSTTIGIQIAEKNPLIPVVLELGGKDSAIVLKDADLEKATKEIVSGAFTYNGQRCTAIKRVLVDSKVEGKLLELIENEVEKLTIGSAKDGNFNITEMIDIASIKYNLELLLDANKNGAKINQKIKRKGNILYPIVLHNVSLNCKVAWEEQFGPILPIISFEKVDDVIEICNESEYGLQTSIFTNNIEQAKRIASQLDVVTVNINKSSSRTPDIFPFGGIKFSGKGLQGVKDSILSMNRIKGIVENN